MMKSFFSPLLAFFLAVSMALTQVSPVYAVALPAEINKQFTPLQIDSGGTSVLRISIFNPNIYPLTNVAFTDNLVRRQPGLFVDTPNGVVNTCGGTLTAVPGSNIITLSGGGVAAQTGSLPGQCYVEINISSVTAGNLINEIPAHNPPADLGLSAAGNDAGTNVIITNTTPANSTLTVISVNPPSMTKGFVPNTIFVGDVSVLTITINNNDVDTNLTGATYTDTLPTGLEVSNPANITRTNCGAGNTFTAPSGGTTITLSNATITPSLNCVVTLNVRGVTPGEYINRIPAGPAGPGSLQTDQGVTNAGNVDGPLNVQPVGVVKLFSPLTIDAGDTTTLTITLQNPSNTPQTVTSVLDTLPANLTIVGTPTTTCGGTATVAYDPTAPASWVLTDATIPASANPPTPNTCTITAVLQADLDASGNRTNTIPPNSIVSGTPGFTNFLGTSSTVTINPAITGSKAYAAPFAIALGGTNTVTITLNNNSSTDFTDVDFTDTLPTGLTVSTPPVPATTCTDGTAPDPTVTNDADSVTLTNGEIVANSSCTVTFNVTSSTPGSGTTYENTIPVSEITACTALLGCVGNNTTITTGTDLTVVDALQLPVTVAKSFVPAVIAPGQTSRIRITITAPLDIGVSLINITDTLPAGLVIAPNTPPTPAPTENCPGGTLIANPGENTITFSNLIGNTLNAGTSCFFEVSVVAADPGSYDNIIPANTVSTSQGRTNAFDSNNANLRVTGMNMSKAFFPTTVQAGGITRLSITLENTSPAALINVTLTDNLPGTATDGIIVAPTPNPVSTCGGTFNPIAGASTFTLNGGTIPAQVGGVPGICTLNVDVRGMDSVPSTQSSHTNTIAVTDASGEIVSPAVIVNPTAPAQATLTIRNLTIGIVKGFNPVLVYGGETSTMTVQLINPNSTALTGVAFTDNMALLSAGIVLGNPPDFNTGTCGGTLTGAPGAASFSFSGGTILPNSSCSLTLSVVMNVNGNRTNRIPAGAVTTTSGVSSTQATEASLTNLPGVSVNKVFNPNPVAINQVSTLTIVITNTSTVPVVNMQVNDNLPGLLPTGLEIANPSGASTTCGGTLTATNGTQLISLVGGGIAGESTCQITVNVVSTRPGVYINTIPAGGLTGNGGISNNNPTSDSLTVGTIFSLGNRVWFDTNNNSLIGTGEVGVDGVVVQLYAADASGAPTGTVIDTQTTSTGGYYRFDNLGEGDYVVVIPVDNFRDVGAGDLAPTNPLAGYWSSGTSLAGSSTTETGAPDPDDDLDNTDNGTLQVSGLFANAVISNAVTLGTNAVPVEPTDDDDEPLPNPFGEAPDERSNRTVDFGFYRTAIGNLTYVDENPNGLFGGIDTVLPGVIVQLFASDGTSEVNIGPDGIFGTNDDAPGGMVSDANGLYSFSGLPNGDYIVRVTPPAGYASTVDINSIVDSADPDFNINNNDNGIGVALAPLSSSSGVLTMAAGETGTNTTVTQGTGTTNDTSVDFGFISTTYSLGNRVWFDTDNSATLNGTEVGVTGVRVNLYNDNGPTAGVFDTGDTFITFDTTDATGYYRFDNLTAGNYVVGIPADNFRDIGAGDTVPGNPLSGYWSSSTSLSGAGVINDTTANDPDTDTDDNDDNGRSTFIGSQVDIVASAAVTLGPAATEPINDNDPLTNPEAGEAPNNRSDRTVDFGFYRGQIGNLVFGDTNSNGTYDAGDTTITGATVQLFASNGTTEINVGIDGILGTSDDNTGGVTTGAAGTYLFSGLPQGEYIVRVTPPAGYNSTVDTAVPADTTDPDGNADNNDNGVGTAGGAVSSNVVTLTPGNAGLLNNNTVTNASATTLNPTLDFGFNSIYSLGNRVWFDTDNNGLIDGLEVGVNGVRVNLYSDDGTTTGVFDAGDTFITFDTTDATGYYRFDNLANGEYIVTIPADNFRNIGGTDSVAGDPLAGYLSSGTSIAFNGIVSDSIGTDPDTTVDSDDNGVTTFAGGAVNYVSAQAVTLGTGPSEPTAETDPLTNPEAGESPDAYSNRTVDFGFYRQQLSNQIFVDTDGNGAFSGVDTGLSNSQVQLYSGNGATEILVGPDGILGTADDAAGGVTTIAGGTYLFSGLPEGQYIVRVTPPTGYSTVDTANPGDTTTPTNNIDNNDNGVGQNAGQVSSNLFTMNPGTTGVSTTVDNSNGTTSNPSLDFGFIAQYSLGNFVWFDTNNNGLLNAGEVSVPGVRVNLHNDNGSVAGVFDTGDTFIGFDTTDANGFYRFDNLGVGNYIVVIPADNFRNVGTGDTVAGDPLSGYFSSGTNMAFDGALTDNIGPDPDTTATDSDDNGTTIFAGRTINYVSARAVTLGPGVNEPVGETDPATNPEAGEAPDNQSNRTVDFGFYRMQLGDQIYQDVNENGTFDAGDLPLPGARVQLFASNGTTQINVGPDGILGTADDAPGGVTTAANGLYLFSGLPAGSYIVRVLPTGYPSTVDTAVPADTLNPNSNVDDNDNGVGVVGGTVSSNIVTLTPGSLGAGTNNVIDNPTGTTFDPTVDFGYATNFGKTIISTDATHTTGTNVTIGEIITYEITMTIPVGTLNNIQLLDIPQSGLAFVDCISITLPANVTSTTFGTGGVCNASDGIITGTSNPLIENSGERVTFNFGNITNSTLASQIVRVRYSLIVLDILANQDGDELTNSATWTWTGGTRTTSASPVQIIEPELTIDKNAIPTSAALGSVITFTIDIAHSSQSSADAFDVVITDQIPAGLAFIPGSINVTGTAPTSTSYNATTNILTIRWDVFQLGDTARVTFQATFVGPAPVVNSASVEWTSLLVDPAVDNTPPNPDVPEQLSDYNVNATERWYDPTAPAGVNNYDVVDSVTLNSPSSATADNLPSTGFAPNIITELPLMPEGFSYAQTALWIEIPKLGLKMDIVGVPFDTDSRQWDLTWLADNAGWLENTAYPTHAGNSAITAHTTLANGLPGPFTKLETLSYGDQVIVHLGGQKYIYEVRGNKRVSPSAVNSVLKHEEYPWLTLITCKSFNIKTGDYIYRTAVRAVLIKVVDE